MFEKIFGTAIAYLLFFVMIAAPPTCLTVWIISLFRYRSLKKLDRKAPGTVSNDMLYKRKAFLFVMSVLAVICVAFILMMIGLVILIGFALSNM